MSDVDGGSRDRATVALVAERIATVGESVLGLKTLTEAEFKGVNTRLDKLEGLPERVTRLETAAAIVEQLHVADRVGGLERVMADHEHRLIDSERERDREHASWAIHWPTLLPALGALLVALLAVYIAYKFHA